MLTPQGGGLAFEPQCRPRNLLFCLFYSVCVCLGTAQDGLIPVMAPPFSPVVPYDLYVPNPSNPEAAFHLHPEECEEAAENFPSVDLSFLPDELTQDNKGQPVIPSKLEMEESCENHQQQGRLPSPSEQGAGLGPESHHLLAPHTQLLQAGGTDSHHPSPEKPSSDPLPLASITPMMPMTPVTECSGIVPQLQ